MPVSLELMTKLNDQLRIRVMQLEAKVIELTDVCLDWRDHHDYMAELRANVDRVTEGVELIAPDTLNIGTVAALRDEQDKGKLDPEGLEWEPIE